MKYNQNTILKSLFVIILILVVNIAESHHLKKAFKATMKGKCSKASKQLTRTNNEELTNYPLTFNLQKAIYFENCSNSQSDSAGFYFATALNLYKNVNDADHKFLDKFKVDKNWIESKINSNNYILATEKFLTFFINNYQSELGLNDSLEIYLRFSKLNNDSTIAPACYSLCQGLFTEFIEKKRMQSCPYFDYFLNPNKQSYYDTTIIQKDSAFITDLFMHDRLNTCKYYCQLVIENLNIIDDCQGNNKIGDFVKLSNSEGEQKLFPITNLYANGLYYLQCQHDSDKACMKFLEAIEEMNKHSKDSLYSKFYQQAIVTVIHNFTNSFDCYKEIYEKAEAPLVKLDTAINKLRINVKKTVRVTVNNKTITPNLETKIVDDGKSLRVSLYYGADIWSYFDNIGLGVYKTPIIDSLISKSMLCMDSLFSLFDTVNLETHVLGIADGTDIGATTYDGEFSSINKKLYTPIYSSINNHEWYRDTSRIQITKLDSGSEISDVQLAFLRAYNIVYLVNKFITESPKFYSYKLNNKVFAFDYPDIKENERPEFRKLEIVFVMKNVLLDIERDYEKRRNFLLIPFDERTKEINKKYDSYQKD